MRRAWLLSGAAMVAFAANSLLCRAALGAGRADATSFTSLRLVSGAIVLGLLARRGPLGEPEPGSWLAALALFGYALAFSVAYGRIPAALGALLLFAAVQATMIGAALLQGDRPRPLEWLGLGIAFVGLVTLTRPGLAAPDALGSGLMLISGVGWGCYSLLGRRARDPLRANASHFLRAAPLGLIASAASLALAPPRLTGAGLALAVASGSLASGVGYAVWYAALRGLTATQAAIVQLLVPPLAALGAVLFLGERPSLRLLAAGAMILCGVGLAVSGRRKA
jgi:drug/metabolite transporter (DMT)-like permease